MTSRQHLAQAFTGILLFLAPLCAGAQTSPAVADCEQAGLQAAPRIFEAPEGVHVVAVEYRNPTATPCRLHRYGRKEPYLQLEPGAIANASFRWKTSSGVACSEKTFVTINVNVGMQGVLWNSGGVMLQGAHLLPPVCGDFDGDSIYSPGPFLPDWPETKPTRAAYAPTVALTTVPPDFYGAGSSFDLAIGNIGNDLPLGADGCPIVVSEWTVSGFLRVEERPSHQCTPLTGWRVPYLFDAKVPLSATSLHLQESRGSPGGDGPRVSRFAVFTGYSGQGEMLFVRTGAVTLDDRAPSSESIIRHWGPEQHGVRVSLTLDKTHYRLGEDIPLHIFVEETASERPLYTEPFLEGQGLGPSLFDSLSLELSDRSGPQLGSGRRGNLQYPLGGVSGHIRCPRPLKAGEEIRGDRSLKHVRMLPKTPGTYTLAVSWSVWTSDETVCPAIVPRPRPEPLATVKSPEVIVIIDPAADH